MRLAILFVGFFVAFAYILPLYETKLNIGNLFGAGVGIALVAIGTFYDYVIMIPRPVRLAIGAIVLIAWVAYSVILVVIICNSRKTATNEDIVIVLGCRVKWDKPSLALIERCNAAAQHLEQNPNAVAILSGGQGKDESMSEAVCMFGLLVKMGINPSRLYVEDKSTSTDENICFSKQIISDNNLKCDIAIATSEYHQLRAKMICKKYEINPKALPSKTVAYTKPPFYTREAFGVLAMLLKIK